MNWQPIETADKDAWVDILVSDGKFVEMANWTRISEIGYGWITNRGYQVEPTHWMPLPQPPKETGK